MPDRRAAAVLLALSVAPAPATAQETYRCTTEAFSTFSGDAAFIEANLRKTHEITVLPDRVRLTTRAPGFEDFQRDYLFRDEDILFTIAEPDGRPDDRLILPTNRARLLEQDGRFPATVTLQSFHFANSWLLDGQPG